MGARRDASLRVTLMQPFAIELYTWSFAVILAGTVAFLVTSHFPE